MTGLIDIYIDDTDFIQLRGFANIDPTLLLQLIPLYVASEFLEDVHENVPVLTGTLQAAQTIDISDPGTATIYTAEGYVNPLLGGQAHIYVHDVVDYNDFYAASLNVSDQRIKQAALDAIKLVMG